MNHEKKRAIILSLEVIVSLSIAIYISSIYYDYAKDLFQTDTFMRMDPVEIFILGLLALGAILFSFYCLVSAFELFMKKEANQR